jgi:hypothetical protein
VVGHAAQDSGASGLWGGLRDHDRSSSRILRGLRQLAQYFSDVSDRANGDVRLGPRAAPAAPNAIGTDLAQHEELPPWMRPEFIDAIARRILELDAHGESATDGGLLTVSQVARRLNVSRHWVYAHKRDLGAIRLGQGPKARLRFDASAVLTALNRRNGSMSSGATDDRGEPPKRTRRRLVSRPLPRASRGA